MEDINIKDLRQVVNTVKEVSGYDFTNYAVASLRRRILRLTETHRIHTLREFLNMVETREDFIKTFISEVTVNTTEMFRDPTFWTVLRENILPSLASKERLNIWHAACSSGEEVLSMAILLKEANMLEKARFVATDINQPALDKAAKAVYPLRNQKLNQMNYEKMGGKHALEEYYTIEKDHVQYDLDLIKNVRYKQHDLTRDMVPSIYDLILCRNVMIYFNIELQEHVISLLHEGLYKDGFLGIGTKESLSSRKYSRYFAPISIEEKVFKKTI